MDYNMITYLACICFIFIFGRIFILPIKKLLKLLFNSILGGFLIFIINIVGQSVGFHIGLNIFTSIVVRNIGNSRCYLFNYCKIIDRIKSVIIDKILWIMYSKWAFLEFRKEASFVTQDNSKDYCCCS